MDIRQAERLVAGAQEMKKSLGGRGIEVGNFLRGLEQAFVTGEVLEEQVGHD
jgi:hypothetical protein